MVDAEAVTNGHSRGRRGTGATSTSLSATAPGRTRERYGYVAAGGGEIYTKPLENLFPGARVFLYKPYPVKGFVGVGIVKEKSRPVTEFEVEVDGQRRPILEAPLADPRSRRATTPTTRSCASTSSASNG